ncbi:MAG: sugar ABC transporter permease [Clostridiaceae bacterium]|nr:sugar ABC transporter permease [Clostridiaceae bacterium]
MKNMQLTAGKLGKKRISSRLKNEIQHHGPLYLLSLPGIIALILFGYMPMFGLVIVFKAYNFRDGIFGSPWVGFKNFEFFFSDIETAWRATSNTIILNTLYIVLGTIFSVAIAIMLNEVRSKIFRRVSQSVILLPYLISWVALGSIMFMFLNTNGLVNDYLKILGISPVAWYMEPKYWKPILVLSHIWKNTGYSSIIYFAALTGFDPSFYEAATIDGASRLQKITKITIPLLKPTIVIMFLLSIGKILNGDLGMMMALTNLNPLLLPSTDIIETYVYRSAIRNGQFEMASAVALYQSVFGFLLILITNKIVSKIDNDLRLF